MAVQPDGKVLVTGDLWVSDNGPYGYMDEIAVRRYNANGTPDSTFGSGGLATVSIFGDDSEEDYPTTILLQPNGDIVVAGFALNPNDWNYYLAVAHLQPERNTGRGFQRQRRGDGSPGQLGLLGGTQPDGKIILAGQYNDQPRSSASTPTAPSIRTSATTAWSLPASAQTRAARWQM